MKLNKKILFFSVLIIGIILLVVFLLLQKKPSPQTTQKPLPVSSDFSKSYSKFNYLKPGKSTYEDVVKLNGYPLSASTFGEKTYLYYPTPSKNDRNVILLSNKIVVYALENVYGDYRGKYLDYVGTYVTPSLTLYTSDSVNGLNWYVFLDKGIAIESNQIDITKILYFIAQDKNSFITSVATDLGLSETAPINQGEVLIGP